MPATETKQPKFSTIITVPITITDEDMMNICESALIDGTSWFCRVILGEPQLGEFVSEQIGLGGTWWVLVDKTEGAGKENAEERTRFLTTTKEGKKGYIMLDSILGSQRVSLNDLEVYEITRDKLVKGIEQFARSVGKTVHLMSGETSFDPENVDSEIAYHILQLAAFGEVVYG